MIEPTAQVIVESPYKKVEEKIIIDVRNFIPCNAKEIEEWSWKKMKSEKWVVHVKPSGKITKRKINA